MGRRIRVLAALLTAGALLLPASPATGQGGITECGDVDGPGVGIKNLTTRGVSCYQARRIARVYERGSDRTPAGFRCRRRSTGQPYEYDTRCTRGARAVRWQYVAD